MKNVMRVTLFEDVSGLTSQNGIVGREARIVFTERMFNALAQNKTGGPIFLPMASDSIRSKELKTVVISPPSSHFT